MQAHACCIDLESLEHNIYIPLLKRGCPFGALRWQFDAEHSLLAGWAIRGDHKILLDCLPSSPDALNFNLAQPIIQSLHCLWPLWS